MSAYQEVKDKPSPINLAASRIRANVASFVKQELRDAFPRNYVYRRGFYNRVFVVIEGHGDQYDGFFESGHLITLEPDGQFRSGKVVQDVGDDTHSWKFYDAKLSAASDMEVVRYAPLLVTLLFNQIQAELKEDKIFKRDTEKWERWESALQKRDGEIFAVLIESQKALIDAGEDPEIPSAGAQDYGSLAMTELQKMIDKMRWGSEAGK